MKTIWIVQWNAGLRRGHLISVRKFQSIAPVKASLMAISLARQVSVKPYIRGTVNGNHKRKIPYGIVSKAPAGNMALGPNLIG